MLRTKILLASLVFALPISATEMAKLTDIIPNLIVHMPHKTDGNFTHKRVYPANADAYLLQEAAHALAEVQKDLNKQGLGLLIWDAYRPLPVQEILWSICPDENYVADPKKGSRHNRGAAVDVTLIRLSDGKELNMPTLFDDFSELAWRNTTAGLTEEQIKNRSILEKAMHAKGFKGIATEWWHFEWGQALEHPEKYPVLAVDFDELG